MGCQEMSTSLLLMKYLYFRAPLFFGLSQLNERMNHLEILNYKKACCRMLKYSKSYGRLEGMKTVGFVNGNAAWRCTVCSCYSVKQQIAHFQNLDYTTCSWHCTVYSVLSGAHIWVRVDRKRALIRSESWVQRVGPKLCHRTKNSVPILRSSV
jgi:hypothetical protein